jgi:hypothetical protein
VAAGVGKRERHAAVAVIGLKCDDRETAPLGTKKYGTAEDEEEAA